MAGRSVETAIASTVTVVPGRTIDRCRDVATGLGVSLEAAFLAGYARVVGALTGDPDVNVSYASATAPLPISCRLSLSGQSWLELTARAQRAIDDAAEPSAPAAAIAEHGGRGEPAHVLDLSGGRSSAGAAGSWLRLAPGPDGPLLQVRCGGGVRRYPDLVAGYFLAALQALHQDPTAPASTAALISAEETRFQLKDLAGPARQLPDRRCHELFQDRVAADPDRLAAVHGDRRWSYAELNGNANRLAHALLSSGVRGEDVVAVAAERGLPWMAAVIAVLKAGAVYLPIEPALPPHRIAAMLARSGCRFVLADASARANLDAAVCSSAPDPAPTVLALDAAIVGEHCDRDPAVPISADQLAYIYFTSGSTGEPKGAMCEHAGLLNHLLAKVEDLGIDPDQVVAQVAPQGFDISLWQLLAATLVGGHTVIVPQDAILDVRRFRDVLIGSAITVLQLVPSYLEVLLAHAESGGGGLGAVRRVSVTGEALSHALAERWFVRFPDIPLMNAYGLTETSDDTNHEMMTAAPKEGPVPLGRPVRNVSVYLVDESLALVPLGSPGEIVFSGVCVGRGYVNDPVRTRQAFLADPYRPGRRLYRSGDFGCWRPDGKLEYLGRRDAQVKISGFRIEIGEVEARLARHPAVREAVVVVAGASADRRRLVAFHTAAGPVTAEALRAWSAESLPEFMVPARFHALKRLPRTANGKTDRTVLTRLADELYQDNAAVGGAEDAGPPRTPTEHMLAETWAEVLRIEADRISRADEFFELGGTSLSAVRLVLSMGGGMSLQDVVANPVLADLAQLIDAGHV